MDHPFDVAHANSLTNLTAEQRANVLANSRAKRDAVTRLGKSIGFGALMQLAEQAWRDSLPEREKGDEFAHGPCASALVRCPGCKPAREAGDHCDWCCGSGRVTKRVAEAIASQP